MKKCYHGQIKNAMKKKTRYEQINKSKKNIVIVLLKVLKLLKVRVYFNKLLTCIEKRVLFK